MRLVDRVPLIDPTGGRFGLGLIRGEADIRPEDWYMTCHFVDDRVMPGTLMYECCLHTLRIFLARLGWIGEDGEVACQPVPGVASKLKCRGQVIESTQLVTYEVSIKEIGYRPEPYVIVDALMFADGKPIVEITDMSLRMTGLDRDELARIWAKGQRPALYDGSKILAFAIGKPSEAFGDPYRIFDEGRKIARLPGPPYQFLDRIVEVSRRALEDGGRGQVAVAEYDVPPDCLVLRCRSSGGHAVRGPPGDRLATLRLAGRLCRFGVDERRRPLVPQPRRLGGPARADRARSIGTLTTET